MYPDIWKTKAAFFSWLRGQLRRALWERYPPKLKFKNENCHTPPKGMQTKAKSGAYCALSGQWTGKSQLEVDHIVGNVSLNDWDDFVPFCQHLLTTTNKMQLVSKEAHKIKSYAERYNITFEEAIIEKKVIAFNKLSVNEQREELEKLFGEETASNATNADLRAKLYRQYVEKGLLNASI